MLQLRLDGSLQAGAITGAATLTDWPLEIDQLYRWIQRQPVLAPHGPGIVQALQTQGPDLRHGDLPRWIEALSRLPDLPMAERHLDAGVVAIELASLAHPLADTPDRLAVIRGALLELVPWRKGPFRIGPIDIDTEWRSDWKWKRLAPHISPLSGRTVLDVGCGNGYHLWRILGAGARTALGIDPGLLFVLQFRALRHYLAPGHPAPGPETTDDTGTHRTVPALLPLTLDSLPRPLNAFDTSFSMGVLYHRRDPVMHLHQLFDTLRPGGELVLETLVLPDSHSRSLIPAGRYARMRNVWSLPTVPGLVARITEAGFIGARCVSLNETSVHEQRPTLWMPFQSLEHALHATDPALTIEGLPRPQRAIVIATRPGS